VALTTGGALERIAAIGQWLRRRPDLVVPIVLVVAFLVLSGGFAFKAQCFGEHEVNGHQYSTGCYNDIQYLWVNRGLGAHVFPYVHGHLVQNDAGTSFTGGTVEYPALTGVFIWLTALPAHGADSFLTWSAVALAPFGLLAAFLLASMTGWRSLLFVAAPSLVLYAFHNWDLLVVAATITAFYAWWRERYALAGALLGVGAALKLYPLFFLAPLLLDRLLARDRRGALRGVGAGVLTVVLVNVPFALVHASGWWAPYAFQRLRDADYTSDSIWVWGAHSLSRSDLNRLTPVLIGVSFVVALAIGWWRGRRDGEYPFVQVCGAMLMAFVLFNKVFSPQYALWLLPFFALVRVRWGWWVAFIAADVLLYVGLFRWYYDVVNQGMPFTSLSFANEALIVGIWFRAVVVGLLFFVFLFARAAVTRPEVAVDA